MPFRPLQFGFLQTLLIVAAAALLCESTQPIARGDIFRLKSGGQVVGAIIDRGQQGEYVIQSNPATVITLSRRQVDKVISQDKIDLLYAERSRRLPDTVEAHRELAEWCKQNRLTQPTQHHLRRIIELDPMDASARLSLGYQQHRGRWLTRDEIMAARGLLSYGGDYRTPQDIALREREKQRETAETDWFRKIRTWVGWLDDRHASEAAELIAGVKDPYAAPAIIKLLEKRNNPQVRDLLIATLAELNHPAAVTTLVNYSLYDPDREVRLRALDYLLQFHRPISLQPYVNALVEKKNENVIINRAAEALHRIGDPRAISRLIDALVTTHKFRITDAPPGNTGASFTPSGGGGLSAGDKPKFYKRDVRNLKVRRALVELSGGQDYEFDERRWRMWFVNEQIHEYVDARRDQ